MDILALNKRLEEDAANGKLGKITRAKKSTESMTKVDIEMVQLAEFGLYYGWGSVLDVMYNRIAADKFIELLKASRVVNSMNRYNSIIDSYAVVLAVQPSESKGANNAKMMTKLLKDLERQWRM